MSTTNLAATRLPNPSYATVITQFQREAPVDVVGLAQALGLKVWEMPLDPFISGKLFKDLQNGGSSGYSIGVNKAEAFVRKRFTVAHEIAHFVLHRNRISNELVDDTMYRSQNVSSAEELQANNLAAGILMPLHLIQIVMNRGIRDVDALARAFKVSGTAMRIRLQIFS